MSAMILLPQLFVLDLQAKHCSANHKKEMEKSCYCYPSLIAKALQISKGKLHLLNGCCTNFIYTSMNRTYHKPLFVVHYSV